MNLSKTERKNRFKQFIIDIDKHEIFTLAGSLAYTNALAFAPFVLISISFASLLGVEIQKKIYLKVTLTMGKNVTDTIFEIVKNANNNSSKSGLAGIIAVLVFAVSVSTIFIQLRLSLNKIIEYQPEESSGLWNFLKERFLSVGFVFGFVFLTIISLLVEGFIAVELKGNSFLWKIIFTMISFIIFSILLTFIYRFIPSRQMDWRRCVISGIVSSIFYLIGENLISLYIGKVGIESSYGAAGSLIVFLTWVYYINLTFLISYEFTKNIILPKP